LQKAQETIAQYMAENEDAAMETAAKTLDLSVDAVKEMYAYYDFSLKITETDVEGFQKTADFMHESGMIDDAYDVSGLFFS